ncbi:Hypothetical protein R9X50_00385300 [Acrodontium crateriforme]|uniref:INO80 complex subunit B-like conserved region domain-containing protein n=1 Tax=Acrodontium crateriforme TaxID=150365 RepID=A0AAQ3R7U3_9PEZI|nr:Hypothetical protein R9X50_00385300 [Acrodontium crateriforme]
MSGRGNSSSRSVPRGGAANNGRLTIKVRPSKLRQATSSSYVDADTPSDSDATPQPTVRTARSTRNPRTVIDPESDEIDDDMEDEEEQDVDETEGDLEQDNDDSEEDAEGEEDDDMDELQVHHPARPAVKAKWQSGKPKSNIVVSAPSSGPLKSVEDKKMEDDDDDDDDGEELSELDSNDENINDEDEEMDDGEDEDGDGDDDDDDDEDDEDEEGADGFRSVTPDLSKLTRRQRGLVDEPDTHGLMALSNEAQKKKHFTDEENKMRRLEMARRRKDLSEKRNEEEKMETINKLLKKPAPKRRTRAEILAAQHAEDMGTPGAEDGDGERPVDPLFTRWVTNREGSRTGVPEAWLASPVGDVFRSQHSIPGDKMIEEIA